MHRFWNRLTTWWSGLTPRQRRNYNVLTLVSAGYLAHYLVFTVIQPFYIEDCAISFAFSRHLMQGEGLVAFPGGERVEGYSNPLWTFLIALFMVFRISVWTSSKILGAVFGLLCLPMAWDLTRRARAGREDLLNFIPPFLLAASTQFVLWNASGLENSLFCVLLTASMWRTVKEGSEGGFPWSAFFYFLLAITRPEGIAYAVVGFGARLIFAIGQRRVVVPMLAWLGTLLIPLFLYHWWRYEYFAWPWPNTYYAKMAARTRFKPFDWRVRGWKYLNNYLTTYWIAYASPLLFLGASGLKRWRGRITLLLLAVFGVVVLWDGKGGFLADWDAWKDIRRDWETVRTGWIYGSAFVVGLLTLGRPGWRARSVVWATFCGVFLYILYTGGDWMDAFRWPSLMTVPMFIMLGLGIDELVRFLPWTDRRIRWRITPGGLMAAAATIALAVPNAWGSYDFAMRPETQVRDVRRRVAYMTWVQNRLHRDYIQLLDVDMGAHLWYSGWDIMDVAGLVDVPMAHHNYERDFIREHVFEENRPDFIHSHGGWARRTRINKFPEFEKRYFEIPGYPVGGRTLHLGNHVFKGHWAADFYAGPAGRLVPYGEDLVMEGWRIPSPVVPREGKLFVETWFHTAGRKHGFRVLVFLADDRGHLVVRDTAPGYDWYAPEEWGPDEHIFTGFDLTLPEDLPTGDYTVGLVLLDEKTGEILPPFPATGEGEPARSGTASEDDSGRDEQADEDDAGKAARGDEDEDDPEDRKRRRRGRDHDEDDEDEIETIFGPFFDVERRWEPVEPTPAPRPDPDASVHFVEGEYILPIQVRVVSREQATEAARADLAAALDLAAEGACVASWERWKEARFHIIRNRRWHNEHMPEMESAQAACWVKRARAVEDRDQRAEFLIRGYHFDHHHEELLSLTRPLAEQYAREGDTHMAEENWEAAYEAFRYAVRLDPQRSWSRRKAERCRDERLDIDGKGERDFFDSFLSGKHRRKRVRSRRSRSPKAMERLREGKEEARDPDDEKHDPAGKGKEKAKSPPAGRSRTEGDNNGDRATPPRFIPPRAKGLPSPPLHPPPATPVPPAGDDQEDEEQEEAP